MHVGVDDSGRISSPSHISVDDTAREEHVEAGRGEYDVRTETGKFYDVVGAAGLVTGLVSLSTTAT